MTIPLAPFGPDASAAPSAPTTGRSRGRRLHGAIAQKIGTAILSGEYAPGDVLPGEVAYAQTLQVSRSAYREAMQVLTAKGLVESRPKTGTRVLPRVRWHFLDPDVLAWAFASRPDINFVRSLFELRAIIEPAAARLAATRRTNEELAAMKDALDRMARHTLESDAGQAADRDFHTAILRSTHNEALAALCASIGAAVSWTTQFKQRARALPRNAISAHDAVYQAVADARPEAAAEAMHQLIAFALEDTRHAIER